MERGFFIAATCDSWGIVASRHVRQFINRPPGQPGFRPMVVVDSLNGFSIRYPTVDTNKIESRESEQVCVCGSPFLLTRSSCSNVLTIVVYTPYFVLLYFRVRAAGRRKHAALFLRGAIYLARRLLEIALSDNGSQE